MKMTMKITPEMPLMVLDSVKGVGLKRKESSDLFFGGTHRNEFHKLTEARVPPPQWEKGIFIDIYA
jgi:hypothetical protein